MLYIFIKIYLKYIYRKKTIYIYIERDKLNKDKSYKFFEKNPKKQKFQGKMAEKTAEKHKLDPQTNVLQISSKREVRFFIFLAKIYLKKYEEIELHALGDAISLSVRVAENLARFGYVTITNIRQFTFMGDEGKEKTEETPRRKLKLVVKVKKTQDFDKKTADIEK